MVGLPAGWYILMAVAAIVAAFYFLPRAVLVADGAWSRWREMRLPQRYVAPLGEEDLDRWVVEGMCAYGDGRRNLLSGVMAGVALPWLAGLVVYLYAVVNNWFAPSWSQSEYGLASLGTLIVIYAPLLIQSSLLFAGVGALFASTRRALIRIRLEQDDRWWSYLVDSRLFASMIGWALYAGWALWPRGPGGAGDFRGALQYAWLWFFCGPILSGYLHRMQAVALYRLYLRRWADGVAAAAKRMLKDQLQVRTDCLVVAHTNTGKVVVSRFPQGRGAGRVRDLITRIPGVEAVEVRETEVPSERRERVITVHVPPASAATPATAMIRWGRWLYTLGVASGFLVYGVGLVYSVWVRRFLEFSPVIVVLSIQTEAVGILAGYALRHLLCRRGQSDLPQAMEETLNRLGKPLLEFTFGQTWQEAYVHADITRHQAEKYLVPVAAEYGIERLLVRIPEQQFEHVS